MSITVKILFAYTLAFGLALSGFAFVIYESSQRAEMAKLDARLESHANKLQAEIQEQVTEKQFPLVDTLAAIRTEGLAEITLRLLDTNGSLVFGDSLLSHMPVERMPPGIDAPPRVGFVNIHNREERSLWMSIEVNDRTEFVVQLAAPLTEMEENLRRLRILFFLLGPVALLFTSGAAYLITRRAFKPISSMVAMARSITATRLDSRLSVPHTQDEVRELAETLNGMIERIDVAFQTQRQFVADASHEIRTPLTIIRTELEFAQLNAGKSEAEESIRIALKELERLSRLSDKLLMLARLDAPGFSLSIRPVRLDELLAECVRHMSKPAAQRRVTLDLHIEEAIELSADQNQLKGVLLNLLDNAVQYSPDGGTVRLSLSVVPNEFARISVEDNGPGITELDLPNVFKRFYRADSERSREGGAGLGLAIAEQVILLHGGKIFVESKSGSGTRFTLEMPLFHTASRTSPPEM